MTRRLRRAGAFAAVATLALAAPVLGAATAVPFAAIAVAAAFLVDDGPLFELFARPGDRRDGRLNGLAGFGFAAAALALLLALPRAALPVDIFVAALLILGFGNLGTEAIRTSTSEPFFAVAGFGAAAVPAAVAGQYVVIVYENAVVNWSAMIFLAIVGTLIAALLRELLYERDDPLVVLSVGLVIWLIAALIGPVPTPDLIAALAVTAGLGGISYGLGTADVSGMLTGVLLGVLTIVLGGFGWFAVLIAFFAIGGLASKFRYEAKQARGVAEDNDGARGTGNVLANAGVALIAVIALAAAEQVDPAAVVSLALPFVFAGSLATALGDTLSSEVGCLYDNPRLITTLEPVEPGTDGAITWQGELAGLAGVGLVGGLSAVALPLGSAVVGGALVAVGGFAGITTDSLLGATVEGDRFGNQSINFFATLTGGLTSVVLAAVFL
ncbi:DUF92 domain-containing protein [Halonotius terrestris]|uniref:DUF92 domain-containing protein n=1 Tax=Halonotius terrestris TaxID=2487750 RepID=A0A8J8P9K7_9EURY|nr:DUF92 domain-containing protein [Halonotius terrestris]TQQ81266.1 DUF92 domain-containing protein [Halonotius terrestris]